MRLMLGTRDTPSLLVDITQEKNPGEFDFWVVNGAWEGTFTNGHITVWHPYEPWSELGKTDILCSDQNRLRGDYNEVFNNFDNPNYVAPNIKINSPAIWDDDIPF